MRGRQRKKVDATFNPSSMTDIVFLLLIFFIVLSTFVSPPGVVIDLPKADGSQTSETTSLAIDSNIDGPLFILLKVDKSKPPQYSRNWNASEEKLKFRRNLLK